MFDKTDQLAVNTIRTLSMDAIQAANSGHPGLPMRSEERFSRITNWCCTNGLCTLV